MTAPERHTPGPWKAVMQFGQWYVRQDPENWNGMGYQHIASLPASRKGTHYGDMFKANARLIEMAPDLLAFVEDVARRDPVFAKGHDKQFIAHARTLVEKATAR